MLAEKTVCFNQMFVNTVYLQGRNNFDPTEHIPEYAFLQNIE